MSKQLYPGALHAGKAVRTQVTIQVRVREPQTPVELEPIAVAVDLTKSDWYETACADLHTSKIVDDEGNELPAAIHRAAQQLTFFVDRHISKADLPGKYYKNQMTTLIENMAQHFRVAVADMLADVLAKMSDADFQSTVLSSEAVLAEDVPKKPHKHNRFDLAVAASVFYALRQYAVDPKNPKRERFEALFARDNPLARHLAGAGAESAVDAMRAIADSVDIELLGKIAGEFFRDIDVQSRLASATHDFVDRLAFRLRRALRDSAPGYRAQVIDPLRSKAEHRYASRGSDSESVLEAIKADILQQQFVLHSEFFYETLRAELDAITGHQFDGGKKWIASDAMHIHIDQNLPEVFGTVFVPLLRNAFGDGVAVFRIADRYELILNGLYKKFAAKIEDAKRRVANGGYAYKMIIFWNRCDLASTQDAAAIGMPDADADLSIVIAKSKHVKNSIDDAIRGRSDLMLKFKIIKNDDDYKYKLDSNGALFFNGEPLAPKARPQQQAEAYLPTPFDSVELAAKFGNALLFQRVSKAHFDQYVNDERKRAADAAEPGEDDGVPASGEGESGSHDPVPAHEIFVPAEDYMHFELEKTIAKIAQLE